MTHRRTLLASALVALVLVATRADAQSRPAYFDEPAAIQRIGAQTGSARVPVVVFLPATGGTSQRMFEQARAAIPFPSYVAILPAGAPSTSDYLPNFGGFVAWMESRITADLERAKATHPVDASRVYLVGFSLGGDTGWAMLAHHPETFAGAVVMGSRASARPSSTAKRTMLSRGCRVSFGMGRSDDATRVSGVTRTYASVHDAGIASEFVRYDGSHEAPDAATIRAMVGFVMRPPAGADAGVR